MPPRTWAIPGPVPHCPLCDCDLEPIQIQTLAGNRICWTCQCSPDTLRLLQSEPPNPISKVELAMFKADTSKWRERHWRHYYRCQQVRNLGLFPRI